jgi:hypothetical protein
MWALHRLAPALDRRARLVFGVVALAEVLAEEWA